MNKNDTETIVKDFLNLWQKQFAHISRDGDSLSKNLEAFANMQEAYSNLMGEKAGTKHAKSATSSDVLRNIGNEFIKLASSYAELEERVTRLESGFGDRGQSDTKKTRTKKPAGTGKRTRQTNK